MGFKEDAIKEAERLHKQEIEKLENQAELKRRETLVRYEGPARSAVHSWATDVGANIEDLDVTVYNSDIAVSWTVEGSKFRGLYKCDPRMPRWEKRLNVLIEHNGTVFPANTKIEIGRALSGLAGLSNPDDHY